MSDTYARYMGCQSSRIHPYIQVESGYKNEHKPWAPRDYTSWSPGLQNELLAYFQKVSYPLRNYEEIPFKDPLRSEIRRFFISLDAYIESPNPVIPYREILYGATDINFAQYLKRVKRKAFETTWAVEHFAYPDWWNDIPNYHINDIGDIFNYSYLIFFKEETDDYLYGDIEVDIKSKWMELFKSTLLELLPDREDFERIEAIEVLAELSPSIAVTRESGKHVPQYQIKNKYTSFSKQRHTCSRSVIRIGPANCRDSVINDPGDLNTIKLMDRQVMEVLRGLPGHIHLRDNDEIDRRLNRLYQNSTFFLHRDIRKEGITKPRELLKAMLEVLHEVYPDIEIFNYTSFYDNYELRIGDIVTHPKRGHGLGMANALTTLMQLVIHTLIMDELINDSPLCESRELALNDDFVVGFRRLEDLEAYWDKEDEVMDGLSIIRQPDKSFYSAKKFVLAERYFTVRGEYEKISYQLRELLLPLCAVNVTHAKEYFIAAQSYVSSKLVPQYLGEICNYWGYEFFPTEFIYPSKVGGWINERINSVDLTFTILEQLSLKSYVFRGFKAAKRKLKKQPQGDYFNPPIVALMGYPKIPEEFKASFDILTYPQLHEKYGRILKGSRGAYNFWTKLAKVRQKEFKKPFECTYEELLESIQKSYPTTQFYPSESMIEYFVPCNIIQANLSDPYFDVNSKIALIAMHNPNISYPFREDFSIRFTERDPTTMKSQSLFSQAVQRTLKSEITSVLATGKHHEVYYPKGDYLPEEQYLNPVKIGEVTAILNWGKGFPKLRKNFEHPLIESKRRIFGRLFTFQELDVITREGLSRTAIKTICDHINNHGGSFIDSVEYLNKVIQHSQYTAKDSDCKSEPIDENMITLERLLTGEGALIWLWHQDSTSWRTESSEVSALLGKLSEVITTATFPGGILRHNAERIKREVEAGLHGPYIAYIANDQGVWKLLDDMHLNEDIWDSDEEPFSLFENG